MKRRLHQTLADYVVIAISPALIMALVGSLVFFLLTVFYQGRFEARLHWVMACFVFAAVLIGRISIEEGMERAMAFGIALAIPMGIAANRYMQFRGAWIDNFAWLINWGLIGLIWWCTHRLVWDCTVIDDAEDASGEGLLQAVGLEGSAADPKAPSAASPIEGTTSREVPAGWWQRYVDRHRRPHAPGVWVVYFSLAALPLFGIGQWFIPVSNQAGRRYAFWLLSLYVASGMGLLLTTSFLGLRRYLRQRRIEMPTLMANLWLGMGTVVIAVLLVFAALLPRPSAEYEISQLPFSFSSPQVESSRMAPVEQEGTPDEKPGPAPERQSPEEPGQNEAPPETGTAEAAKPASDSQSSSAEAAPEAPPQASGAQPSGNSSGGEGSGKSQPASSKQAQRQPPQQPPPQDQSQPPNNPPQESQPQEAPAQPPEQTPPSEPEASPPSDASNPALEAPKAILEATTSLLAVIFKLAFYGVVILATLYFLWRSRAQVLAAIRSLLASLRDFWNRLWGFKRERHAGADDPLLQMEFPPEPFASFADPFATGIAARYSVEELVRYSFEAFEAWAREHGCPRQLDTTPHELAREVGKRNATITADARNLAELYARVAYAQGELPPNSSEQLRHLWQTMRAGIGSLH